MQTLTRNKSRQPYTAAVAAAYAKELLGEIDPATQDQRQIANALLNEKLPDQTESATLDRTQIDPKVSTQFLCESEPFRLDKIKIAAAMISESL